MSRAVNAEVGPRALIVVLARDEASHGGVAACDELDVLRPARGRT
jgi:hypothetical protein